LREIQMGSFIGEFWSFLRIRKKILARSDVDNHGVVRRATGGNPRLGDRAVHLHTVLTREWSF